MTFITCLPLAPPFLPAVLALDQVCFGGLWTLDGYQREIDSPNSDLWLLAKAARSADLQRTPRDLTQQTAAEEPLSELVRAIEVIGVGCLWSILDEAHITTLAIHPTYQRCGLGQLLLSQLLLSAHARQLTHATLEVRVSNRAAVKLYEKFGFKIAGQRKGYYQDGENALILWRSGLQTPEYRQQLGQMQVRSQTTLQNQGWQWLPPNDEILTIPST